MTELTETQPKPEAGQTLAPTAGSAAPDVPVISILKRHLETSVHYQQVASKVGNPEGFAYVKIPDWEVRQIIEHLERQNDKGQPQPGHVASAQTEAPKSQDVGTQSNPAVGCTVLFGESSTQTSIDNDIQDRPSSENRIDVVALLHSFSGVSVRNRSFQAPNHILQRLIPQTELVSLIEELPDNETEAHPELPDAGKFLLSLGFFS